MTEQGVSDLIGSRKLSSRGRSEERQFLFTIEIFFKDEPETVQLINILSEKVFSHLKSYHQFHFKIKDFQKDILTDAISNDFSHFFLNFFKFCNLLFIPDHQLSNIVTLVNSSLSMWDDKVEEYSKSMS